MADLAWWEVSIRASNGEVHAAPAPAAAHARVDDGASFTTFVLRASGPVPAVVLAFIVRDVRARAIEEGTDPGSASAIALAIGDRMMGDMEGQMADYVARRGAARMGPANVAAADPQSIREAIAFLVANASPEDQECIRSRPPAVAAAEMHDGVGRTIRATWKLWDPHSPLRRAAADLGLQGADDACMLVMIGVVASVLGRPYGERDMEDAAAGLRAARRGQA